MKIFNNFIEFFEHVDYIDIICNVILSVIFAASFICIFFFTYAKNVEKQVVINNLNYVVESLVGSPIALLKSYSLFDTSKLSQLNSDHNADAEADKKVADNNNLLQNKAYKYIGIMLTLGLITVITLALCYKDISYIPLVIFKNILLTCGIALTEFIFLICIGAKYMAADNNVIIKQFLININNKMHKSN